MERESFEDEEVAAALNRDFVAIKVDREERPDIDHIYMTVCQAMTGSGGWPMSVFLTPERKPFYAGTYFPKHDRSGMPGFLSILDRIGSAWKDNRQALIDSSEHITGVLSEQSFGGVPGKVSKDLINDAYEDFRGDFDNTYGGFGNAPKFPAPHSLYFLLRYWYQTKEAFALEMVEKTLDSMYRGGIHDHIGGGFSRYSTDRKWLTPHFEKMLYDNALLAIAYLETYQATKKEKYAGAAKDIFTYVLRDMTSPEGGFCSAEDADSEGEEGRFYVWTPREVALVLGNEAGEKFCKLYDITERGNFEGRSIPNLINSDIYAEDTSFVEECRKKLFQYREKRVHPYKDDKILTSWNGLMIAALATGGRILNEDSYTEAAEKAANFILTKAARKDGRLMARHRDGEAAFPGYIDDYAFMVWGLIELYESTFKPEYLRKALSLNDDLLRLFWDEDEGGLYMYGSDSERLITRPKEVYDGAVPSGNSVAALNFLRLARLTGRNELEAKADRQFEAFGGNLGRVPRGHAFLLTALMFSQSRAKEVVIVSDEYENATGSMINILSDDFRPFTTALLYSGTNDGLKSIAPFVEAYKPIEGKTAAYVCENFSCQAPVTDAAQLRAMLQN